MKRIIIYMIVVAALVSFGLAVHNVSLKDQRLEMKIIELQDTSAKLKTIQVRYDSLNEKLNTELEQKEQNTKKIEELESERQKLEQEKIDLQSQLQAKAAERDRLASSRGNTVSASIAVGEEKQALLSAAGVPQSDWQYADYIITRESGWNSCAYYPSKSDCNYQGEAACGIAQALPCSKLRDTAGCKMTDAVCQIKWQYNYVNARYGGYQQAYAFWLVNRWY